LFGVGNIADMLVGRIKRKTASPVGSFLMTVKLGTYPSARLLREAILLKDKKIDRNADDVLESIKISEKEVKLDLWEMSATELGFKGPVSQEEIYNRAFECGFVECPVEAGFLACVDSGDSKCRFIGSAPISTGEFSVLYLGNKLAGSIGIANPIDGQWIADTVWVFARIQSL